LSAGPSSSDSIEFNDKNSLITTNDLDTEGTFAYGSELSRKTSFGALSELSYQNSIVKNFSEIQESPVTPFTFDISERNIMEDDINNKISLDYCRT